MNNSMDAALEYRRRGYFPTPTAGKRPVQDEWEKSRLGEDEIRSVFEPSHNVGIVLGASGLTDLDFDDDIAVTACQCIDPPELRGAAAFEHAGRPHLIVRAVVPTRRFKRADGSVLLELRSEGAQTIFPPSIHPDGLPYTWTDDREPPQVEPGRLQTIASMIATAAYASEFWKPQGRHDLAMALSGFLARRIGPADALAIIQAAASMAGDEELDDRLLAVETTVQRLRSGEPVTGLPTLESIAPDLAKALAKWWGKETKPENEPGVASTSERRNAADRLVEYALASGAEFFHDEQEEPFVAITIDGRRQIHGVSSTKTRRWLARLNWQHEQKAASGETLAATTTALASFALFDGQQHPLSVRVARAGDAIWYDLGDWRAVRVDEHGWEVVDVPPILFRHFRHQRAQPEPLRGGSLWNLLDILNVRDRPQRLLLLVYLVSALVPGIPRPVIVVHGEHGSGKSTLLSFLRELIDPSLLRPQSAPDSVREFVQAASHNLCLFLDNVSHLPDWLSDALCRLCTGDGFSKRQLYTDDDDIIYSLRGLGGVNGINLVATRADLLDRALLFTLAGMSDAERRTEQDCIHEFDRLRPYLLGAMFEALSVAIKTVPEVDIAELPRMADFARWGCAIARHLGCDDAEFLSALGVNAAAQNDTAVENSPVAQAVLRLVEEVGEWEDTPVATLQRLTTIATDLRLDTKGRAWPKQPAHLTRRLVEVAPNLKRLGVLMSWSRTGRRRLITLRGSGCGVTAVTESENAVTHDGAAVTNDGTPSDQSDSIPPSRDASDAGDGTLAGVAADARFRDSDRAHVPGVPAEREMEENEVFII